MMRRRRWHDALFYFLVLECSPSAHTSFAQCSPTLKLGALFDVLDSARACSRPCRGQCAAIKSPASNNVYDVDQSPPVQEWRSSDPCQTQNAFRPAVACRGSGCVHGRWSPSAVALPICPSITWRARHGRWGLGAITRSGNKPRPR